MKNKINKINCYQLQIWKDWCFLPKIEILKYSREVWIIILFVDIKCIGYSSIFHYRVSSFFLTIVPVSWGFMVCWRLREFVYNKGKSLFRIASHFWSTIKYPHSVPTSIFVEIILWESNYQQDLISPASNDYSKHTLYCQRSFNS